MSTENYQVTVYLPPDLLEYIEDYCEYKGILRKKDSKPILATGIVELLKLVAMSPVEKLPITLPDTLPDIDKLIDEKLTEKKLVSKISDSAFITKLSDSKVIHTLLDTLLEDEELKTKLQQGLLDNVPDTLLVSDTDSAFSEVVAKEEKIDTQNSAEETRPKNLTVKDTVSHKQESKQSAKIPNEDKAIPEHKNKTELKDDDIVNIKKADTTSEQSADEKTTHEDDGNDTSKKTFDDTIAKINILHSEGKTNGEIVKVLNNDGYPTSKGSTGKWRSNQVQSILNKTK